MTARDTFTGKAKLGRQNSFGTATNSINQSATNGDQFIKMENNSDTKYKPVFFQEISDIMRGNGDCDTPIYESVCLVEQIVIEQMRGILSDVLSLALNRIGPLSPSKLDFEFLMRRNPIRIGRLNKYLKEVEVRRQYQEYISGRSKMNSDKKDKKKEKGYVKEKYDEERVRRMFRADRISLILNGPQYTRYIESRRTTFHCRSSSAIRGKLETILSPPPEARISSEVYTIFGWLVHETIANIVDYAILTRLNSSNRIVEPHSRVPTSGNSCILCNFKKLIVILSYMI